MERFLLVVIWGNLWGISVLCSSSTAYEIIGVIIMINYCYGCGKELNVTTDASRNTARVICDECYAKTKKAKVTYKILYKNGIEDKIIQEINEEQISNVNNVVYSTFNEGRNGVLTFGDGDKEGYIIRIDDISRINIYKGIK
jgi:hypothetical protein